MELIHGTVDIKVGSDEIEFNADNVLPVENLLSSLTQRVEKRAGLTGCFAQLYPKVRDYVHKRCFGGVVEPDTTAVRRVLNHTGLLDAVAALFARRIAELTVESMPVKLSGAPYRLADTQPFLWRRMITPAAKSIFNAVPCYNAFEARFADYLDRCDDIERFAALAEWFTHFHVQYLSRNGAIKLYYPDFVAVQITAQSPVHWIIETKGREFDDTDAKAAHMRRWCEEISGESGETWRYLKVSQAIFEDFMRGGNLRSFQALLDWHHPQGWLLSA